MHGGGRIQLAGFWARRARRLLPALVLVLLAVAIWAALDPSQSLRSIRLDIGSALLYVANWRFAYSGQGYFSDATTPSPVLHLWSLGVEEQFYLVWPLLVAGSVALARFGSRRIGRGTAGSGRRAVFVLALLGAAGSTAWLSYEANRGVDASRLYYGTDTRALALLTGALLATVLPLPRSPQQVRSSAYATRRWSLLAALALGGLIAIIATVRGQDRLLYRGGFLAVAVVVALLITALIRAPRGPISALLALPPLAHIGRISYGLYLWHWPVILFATAERTGLRGAELLAYRLLAALTLAEVSYWLVERPILGGGQLRPAALDRRCGLRGGRRDRRRALAGAAATGGGRRPDGVLLLLQARQSRQAAG